MSSKISTFALALGLGIGYFYATQVQRHNETNNSFSPYDVGIHHRTVSIKDREYSAQIIEHRTGGFRVDLYDLGDNPFDLHSKFYGRVIDEEGDGQIDNSDGTNLLLSRDHPNGNSYSFDPKKAAGINKVLKSINSMKPYRWGPRN